MELTEIEYKSEYETYRDFIIQRDKLRKEAFEYQEEYLRVFGDLIKESFQLKIDCIELKKKITYCQMCINQNKVISQVELDSHIEIIMQEYNKELQDLINHINISNTATNISAERLSQVKKIYRKIAKKIHPDMNPDAFESDEVKELWNRTVLAYNCNDLDELKNIEVLLDALELDENHDIQIEDIEERIHKLETEIKEIMNTNPYQYRNILESEEDIEEHKQELSDEINHYQAYKSQLQQIFEQFDIQTILN